MVWPAIKRRKKHIFLVLIAIFLIALTLKSIQLTVGLIKSNPILQGWQFYTYLSAPILTLTSALTISSFKIGKKIQSKKHHKEQIDDERGFIKQILKRRIKNMDLEDLEEHRELIEDTELSEEALEPYQIKWNRHLDLVNNSIEKLRHEEEISDLEQEKQGLIENIETLSEQKQSLKKTEQERQQTEGEAFLEGYKDCLYANVEMMTDKQKDLLAKEGFELTHQWDIFEKKSVEVMVKKRSNENPSHAYLVSAIQRYIQNEIDPDVKIYETKMPDIVFTIAGEKWAIEIETGSVLRKSSKQLKEKVSMLNKKYSKRWFFVVSNKNSLAKYRNFGDTIDRAKVIEKLEGVANGED
ncbi:MAG: hypothetical protein KAT77_00825 [Nanoarchaeota archaeon]|nr:hypothetical protein [Nanoarchaeota archaeon]